MGKRKKPELPVIEQLAAVMRSKGLHKLDVREAARACGAKPSNEFLRAHSMAQHSRSNPNDTKRQSANRQAAILERVNSRQANPFTTNLPRGQKPRFDSEGREKIVPYSGYDSPSDLRRAGYANELDSNRR